MTTITTPPSVGPKELRRRRLAAGLTQRRLATLADCSLSWLANAENGYIPRTSPVLLRVLDALAAARKNDNGAPQSAAVKTGDGPADESAD